MTIPETILTLARFKNRFDRQEADVVRFSDRGIELVKDNEVRKAFTFNEITKLVFIHLPKSLPGIIQVFSGSLLQRRAARLIIETENSQLEIEFEGDIEYRKDELFRLFNAFYLSGVPFKEIGADGLPCFLFRRMSAAEVNEKIDILKKTGKE